MLVLVKKRTSPYIRFRFRLFVQKIGSISADMQNACDNFGAGYWVFNITDNIRSADQRIWFDPKPVAS
jgi:hypothetical protein